MPTQMIIECCQGDRAKLCQKTSCPTYMQAKEVCDDRHQPYIGTGYGNLNGETTHLEIMRQVAVAATKLI